jgi:regulator of replication initiation timing
MSAAEIQHSDLVGNFERKPAQKNTPPEKIISIMNEYSSNMQYSPQVAHSVSTESDQCNTETIRSHIFQKNDNSVFILLTIPVTTTVLSVVGEVEDGVDVAPQFKIADAYGVTKGFSFDQTTSFKPGDYCMGLVFSSEKEAQSITTIKLQLQYQQISNLMLSQMIFGLYRSLGFDPSHVMKYPVQSVNRSVPFYRKTRDEINELRKTTESLCKESNNLKEVLPGMISENLQKTLDQTNIHQKLDDLKSQIAEVTSREKHMMSADSYEKEKGATAEKTISVDEYLKIQEERDLYYDKLHEAEDYIEYVMEQREQSHHSPKRFSNAHLSHGTRSLLGKRK